MPIRKILTNEVKNLSNVLMKYTSRKIFKVVHDDIHTPKEDFLLMTCLFLGLSKSRTNMVENPY
jgi:hypothetical protein